jgi:hypothetical protein
MMNRMKLSPRCRCFIPFPPKEKRAPEGTRRYSLAVK